MEPNKTTEEGVVCVYKKDVLVAIIKRDDKTKKKIVYKVKEADVDDIAELISGKEN